MSADRNANIKKLVGQWLRKADHDLVVADAVRENAEGADLIAFHAQQAIEKALKAVLTAHQIPFPKTHDLLTLIDHLSEVPSFLNDKRGTLETISLYGVAARYPGIEQPTHEAALDALATAEKIVQRIRTQLSPADRK